MTDDVKKAPSTASTPNTVLASADKILQIGKDLSTAIGADPKNPADVLNKVKAITTDAKTTLGTLQGDVHNKNFTAVAAQVDKLDKMLQNSQLTGKDVKAAAKTITTLATHVTKLAADISTGNIAGITVDSASVFQDATSTVKMLEVAGKNFHTYYTTNLKPMLKAFATKVVAVEKAVKGDITKAIHWIGDKVHHNSKDASDATHPATTPAVDHPATTPTVDHPATTHAATPATIPTAIPTAIPAATPAIAPATIPATVPATTPAAATPAVDQHAELVQAHTEVANH